MCISWRFPAREWTLLGEADVQVREEGGAAMRARLPAESRWGPRLEWGLLLASILLPTVFLWTWISGVGDLLATRPAVVAMAPFGAAAFLAMAIVAATLRASFLGLWPARIIGWGSGFIGIVPALESALGTPGLPESWIRETSLVSLGRVSGVLSESTGILIAMLGISLALIPTCASPSRPWRRRLASGLAGGAVGISLVVLAVQDFSNADWYPFQWRGISMWAAILGVTLGSVLFLEGRRNELGPRPGWKPESAIPWLVSAGIAVLALGVGGIYLRGERAQVRAAAGRDLNAICDNKVIAVARWRGERFSDARFFGQARFVARDLRAFMEDAENLRHRTNVEDWLQLLKSGDRYLEVSLLDRAGHVRLSAPKDVIFPPESAPESHFPPGTLATNGVIMTDVVFEGPDMGPALMLMAPIPERTSRPESDSMEAPAKPSRTNAAGGDRVGFLRLRLSARRQLFPLISGWPTPRQSGETLFCRKEGEGWLVLNRPVHGDHPEGTLRLPLKGIRIPAVSGQGKADFVEGLDYRDVPVVAVMRGIPDSPWALVSKVDMAEICGVLREEAWLTLGLVALVSAGGGLGLAFSWVRQQRAGELVRLGWAERVALLTQQANDIVLLLDEEGAILEANRRASEAYGCSEDILITRRWHELEPAAEPGAFEAHVARALQNRGRLMESWHVRGDGERFPVEYSLAVGEVDGRKYVQAIVRDLTERYRLARERDEMEAKLRHGQKLESVGTLASGVAHEINNPITAVINYAQLIVDEGAPGTPMTRYAHEVIRETGRVAAIVKQLLQFARRDPGQFAPESLSALVHGAVSLIQVLLKQDQIQLEVDVPEGLPEVSCRGSQIQQVLMNLVTNARDATVERWGVGQGDRRIRIEVRQRVDGNQAQWVRISVEDHGSGIDSKHRHRLFDPFFTTKPVGRGTGLGLSISHGIVKEHGGELHFGEVAGGGAVFHVDLPVKVRRAPAESDSGRMGE